MQRFIQEDNKFYTEEQVKTLKKKSKKEVSVNELYPNMFDGDGQLEFKPNMDFNVGIIWLGSYTLKSDMFGKHVCPVCGKEEVIPYHLVASILSGTNLFKGYCLNCKTKMAYSDHEQYLKIRTYILDNKKNLTNTNRVRID